MPLRLKIGPWRPKAFIKIRWTCPRRWHRNDLCKKAKKWPISTIKKVGMPTKSKSENVIWTSSNKCQGPVWLLLVRPSALGIPLLRSASTTKLPMLTSLRINWTRPFPIWRKVLWKLTGMMIWSCKRMLHENCQKYINIRAITPRRWSPIKIMSRWWIASTCARNRKYRGRPVSIGRSPILRTVSAVWNRSVNSARANTVSP